MNGDRPAIPICDGWSTATGTRVTVRVPAAILSTPLCKSAMNALPLSSTAMLTGRFKSVPPSLCTSTSVEVTPRGVTLPISPAIVSRIARAFGLSIVTLPLSMMWPPPGEPVASHVSATTETRTSSAYQGAKPATAAAPVARPPAPRRPGARSHPMWSISPTRRARRHLCGTRRLRLRPHGPPA